MVEAIGAEANACPAPDGFAVEEEPHSVRDAVVGEAEARPVLDAIVVEEPAVPGMFPPGQPALRPSAGATPDGPLVGELAAMWANWLEAQPAQYMVPQRFGMSGILGMMTALALLFALLRQLDAHPMVYLFFGLLGPVIGIAQMLNNARPRVASVVAGTILVPLLLGTGLVWDPADPSALAILCAMFFAAPLGAFLGYVVGTLAASVFLLMDKLERWWTGRRQAAPRGSDGLALAGDADGHLR